MASGSEKYKDYNEGVAKGVIVPNSSRLKQQRDRAQQRNSATVDYAPF